MNFITKSELNIVLYITHKIKTKDFHNIFKILYWSDREHLVTYGRKLSEDNHAALRKGPVPTRLYDYFKSIKDTEDKYFQIQGYSVNPLKKPNLDYISESEIECIDKIISKYDNTDFDDRTELSHGYAYHAAKRSFSHFIKDTDIAIEGNANDELLKYISITN